MNYILVSFFCLLISFYDYSYTASTSNDLEEIVYSDYSFLEKNSFISIAIELKKVYIENEFSQNFIFFDKKFHNKIKSINFEKIFIKELSKEFFKLNSNNQFSVKIFHPENEKNENKLELDINIKILFLSNMHEQIDLQKIITISLKDPKKNYTYLELEKNKILKSFLNKNIKTRNLENEIKKIIKTSCFSIANFIFNKKIK